MSIAVIISVSCSNLLVIFYGLLCLEKCYHYSALQYEVCHQVKIILFSVALIFITRINLHVNGSRSLDAFCCIIFRLVKVVMESQAPILNNFQVNYLTHSY